MLKSRVGERVGAKDRGEYGELCAGRIEQREFARGEGSSLGCARASCGNLPTPVYLASDRESSGLGFWRRTADQVRRARLASLASDCPYNPALHVHCAGAWGE